MEANKTLVFTFVGTVAVVALTAVSFGPVVAVVVAGIASGAAYCVGETVGRTKTKNMQVIEMTQNNVQTTDTQVQQIKDNSHLLDNGITLLKQKNNDEEKQRNKLISNFKGQSKKLEEIKQNKNKLERIGDIKSLVASFLHLSLKARDYESEYFRDYRNLIKPEFRKGFENKFLNTISVIRDSVEKETKNLTSLLRKLEAPSSSVDFRKFEKQKDKILSDLKKLENEFSQLRNVWEKVKEMHDCKKLSSSVTQTNVVLFPPKNKPSGKSSAGSQAQVVPKDFESKALGV